MMTKTKYSTYNTLYASSVIVDDFNNIHIRGYYENDKPKRAKSINYTKTLDELYDDIIKKRIIIHDTANSYKWYYIIWNISLLGDKDNKIDLFKNLIDKYIKEKSNGIKQNKFIIQIYENKFVLGSNRKSYFFTERKDNAKQYNKFQAAFVYKVMKRCWGNQVKIVSL